MKLFSKKEEKNDPLDQILYKVPGTNTAITWADSLEGTLVTGSTGSGKSSGAGRHIGHAMLKSGYGMCILCVKKDEKKRWLSYIEEAAPHRKEDVVIFNKSSGLKFNMLEYEMKRQGEGAGDILNAVESLMALNEQNRVYLSGGGGGKDERFWDMSLRRFCSKGINTLPFFLDTIDKAGLNDIVIPIVSSSVEASEVWSKPLAMVFIDGGHSETAANDDYDVWHPHIIKGGLLAIHDVFPNPEDGGRPPFDIYTKAKENGLFKEVDMINSLALLEKI